MTLEEAIKRCSAIVNAEGPMREGDGAAIAFKNATIVFLMGTRRHLEIRIIAEAATILDEEIEL